jgi:isopentenyl diphosphate isomerase/L-lactate dehydrogenase-like FMN-dependent dehydrogenase
MSLSTVSTFSIEEVAAVAGPRRWFQLYLFRDRRITQHLIRRAEDSGYTALVITVDVPGTQTNERDVRFAKRGYSFTDETRMAPHLQPDRVLRNFQDVRLAGFELPTPGGLPAFFDSSFTWDDLEELRRTTSLPIVIKGIQCGEDAARCRELGVDGLVVSNHGGFALADASPTVRLLPEVVEAAGSVEVYLDGGVRHGTDVLKSLALGARAVLIGRAQIWGLAVAGEHGVSDVLRILRDELEQAMRHCGAADVAHVSPDLARVCPSLAAPQ